MIDRETRRVYAELVRQFVSGRMTNVEYENRFEMMGLNHKDTAVDRIFDEIWVLYDDLRTHRLTGNDRINAEAHRQIAQVVLFLQSDREYLWPQEGMWGCLIFLLLFVSATVTVWAISSFPVLFLSILSVSVCFCSATMAFLLWKSCQERQSWKKAGDTEAWPFRTQADLAEAKRYPRLLAGKL